VSVLRVAFAGASGTGKTTLARWVSERFGLPINPVGSRSVAAAMGFASPYDVDQAGRRAEFQARLLREKRAWEELHSEKGFVSDRTTLDNLTYTMLHDVRSIDAATLASAVVGARHYTHVVYCPMDVVWKPGGDPARVPDETYHRLYDVVLKALLERYVGRTLAEAQFEKLADRQMWLNNGLTGKWV